MGTLCSLRFPRFSLHSMQRCLPASSPASQCRAAAAAHDLQTARCRPSCPPSRASSSRSAVLARAGSGSGSGPVQAWLDLASLVTGGSKAPGVSEFADAIGREVYIDVAQWHLYLNDAKLNVGLATVLAARATSQGGKVSEADVRETLSRVPVKLGGGKLSVSLLDVLPDRCVQDLADLTRRFVDEL